MISKIKEFLKPNLGKIILTVVFGLVAYYFGWNVCGGYNQYPTSVCIPYYNPIYWGPVASIDISVIDYPVAGITIERWISGIIYWYLIAYSIMFVYGILRRKK